MSNTSESRFETPSCECKQWDHLCDCERYYTREEVEQLTDRSITSLISSDEFEIMDMQERSNLICYLIASKRAMYRCYF